MKFTKVLPLILILIVGCSKPNYIELQQGELTPTYLMISFYLQDFSESNTEKLANIYLDKFKDSKYEIIMLDIYDKNLEPKEMGVNKPSNVQQRTWYVYPKKNAITKGD